MSLDMKDITFRYEKKKPAILDHFSASFKEGTITAILGPNGAGKTTLGKIIMGILVPEKGQVCLDGQDMKDWSLAERGRKIGYVMQNPSRQIFSAKVKDEVEYGLLNLGLEKTEAERRAKEFLSFFDLSQYEDTFPFHLSQGEKQRLVLAAVLAMEPKYLLLDEPTSGLDQKRKDRLGFFLRRIRQEKGCGILMISHDLKFVQEYGQDQILLGGEACV